MTIPASAIVKINPGVIGGGGSALALNGIILTNSGAVPIGAVQPFSSAGAVGSFFSPASGEKALADVYFSGYDSSTAKPGRLFFAQYAAADVAAYLRSGSLAAMTLAQLKALTGTLIVTIDGAEITSLAINMASATSFSDAASIITIALDSSAFASYDSVRAAFVITSGTTGAGSTITAATGTLAVSLKLTTTTGAVTSQGAVASTPAAAMDAVKAKTLNWASFMTAFEPDIDDKLAFAAWTNAQGNRFAYVCWDTDVTAEQSGNTTALGPQLIALNSSGTVPVYMDKLHAAFVLGAVAAIDFARTNGRITLAFKSQSGLAASVTDQTVADNLIANGYNFYGAYATANDGFTFLYPGQVTGDYAFLDEFVNQVWLNSALQLAMMSLLTAVPSIPYTPQGYSLIDAACLDPINAALNFGAIRENVPLSSAQKAQVNNAAGTPIDQVLSTRGWYLQILPATAQVRAARGTPSMTFWYMDGGSVQAIILASIVIQ